MDYLSNAWNVIYYIAYPVIYVLSLVLYILAIVTAPLQYLIQYLAYACWYPVKIVAKFEVMLSNITLSQLDANALLQTLYVFFGIAVLVGGLTGFSLHYVSAFFVSILNLESHPNEYRGRTLASYRAERQARKDTRDPLRKLEQRSDLSKDIDTLKDEHAAWERLKKIRGRTGGQLVPNTILEEDSMDDGSY